MYEEEGFWVRSGFVKMLQIKLQQTKLLPNLNRYVYNQTETREQNWNLSVTYFQQTKSVGQSLQNYLLICCKICKINPQTEATVTLSHRLAGLLVTPLTLSNTYYLSGAASHMARQFSEHFVDL